MSGDPLLGVGFHWLGGLAAASFYVPYRAVRHWAWEVSWLLGGVFSWILAPWAFAWLNTNDLLAVLAEAPLPVLGWSYFWGVLWGIGGLTFGLTMRYLGMSLGMAIALGFCAAFGTLVPPLFHGEFVSKVLRTTSGVVILIGVVVTLLGITIAGFAGIAKERELSPEQQRAAIAEFALGKGLLVATLSGVMSACFAFGLDAGAPIGELSAAHGTAPLWTGLPKLCVVLLGGFTSNCVWCVLLMLKNGTVRQVLQLSTGDGVQVPRRRNLFFCALAGTTWYLQFFCYSMGETQMGDYRFSSWTLHMASIILFSSLWGLVLREWRGTSWFTRGLLSLGLCVLVFATVIVGFGNYLAVPR